VQNREVRKKDGAVRKAWNGKYHKRTGKPAKGRKTLGRELSEGLAEMPVRRISGSVRKKALQQG
jgi:hypothetical protein